MPNHIQNRLKIEGTPQQIKTVRKFLSDGKKMQIDFNKIVPMPPELNISVHSGIETWVKICTGGIDFKSLFTEMPDSAANLFKQGQYATLTERMEASTALKHLTGERQGNVKSFSDADFSTFIQCLKNYRLHGFYSWYEWSIKNWGTKWNAYEQDDKRTTDDTIYFQTAWSAPINLIGKLSELYPECTFQFDYADEDTGCNTGMITFKNGDAINVLQPKNQSIQAYDIYFDLHPDRVNDYKLVGDKYEYIDDGQ